MRNPYDPPNAPEQPIKVEGQLDQWISCYLASRVLAVCLFHIYCNSSQLAVFVITSLDRISHGFRLTAILCLPLWVVLPGFFVGIPMIAHGRSNGNGTIAWIGACDVSFSLVYIVFNLFVFQTC